MNASWMLDLFLLVLAAIGWKRAFDAERDAEKVKQFYEALPKQWVRGKAEKRSAQCLPCSGN